MGLVLTQLCFREVRNPFDLGYLYGISALRLFLPLYFYGCPDNFLTAFPMVRTCHFCVCYEHQRFGFD